MSPIVRRSAFIVISVLVGITLAAIAPHHSTTQPSTTPMPPVAVAKQVEIAPPTPFPAPERYQISPNMNIQSITQDGDGSAQEALDLALIPPPPTAVIPKKTSTWKAPTRIDGYGPRMRGKLVLQTERLDIYVGSYTFDPKELQAVAWKLESLLRQDESGLYPTQLDHRVSIGFYSKSSAPSRGTRGIAYTDAGRIEIYYNPNEDMSGAFTVAAHELAHHLQNQRYGDAVQSRSDLILLEGMATWISGARWLKEYNVPSWRGRAFQLSQKGIPLRLVGAQAYGSDNAYELWASFVSYIYKRYGMKVVDQLYISSRGRSAGSADYKEVTGKSLEELTASWRTWVLAYEPPTPTPEAAPTQPLPATPEAPQYGN